MKLENVTIKNFRSIKEETIDLTPSCRVLVGINESGKTNVLKALQFLDEDQEPVKKDDLREALPGEGQITEAHVWFEFSFSRDEQETILDNAALAILSKAENPEIATFKKAKLTLKKFCGMRNRGLYCVDIIKETKSASAWNLAKDYELIKGWQKPSDACPADFTIELNGDEHIISEYSLIRTSDLGEIPAGYLVDANIQDLAKVVNKEIRHQVSVELPSVLFWEYSEDGLLPNSVKIAEFSEKPSGCVPLENMFKLAGISDIKTSLLEAQKGSSNQFQNYLDHIAQKATEHFRSVWKEYRDIEFSLRLNAEEIIPGVKEKNIHDFAKRSDGFKRFVTFLLLISVSVKTEHLQNVLLLIDEPEASLHPSGARYLRDELIRISKTNYVVYSTHSIFMIDSGEIGRHYIVKKISEITSLEQARTSNISDEEVLYNALGHSVFSVLNEKNIIFEGWSDKHVFQIALEKASAALKKKYVNVGFCHSQGAKAIKAITPMIELAKRECLILSDSDNPSKEQQKLYKKEKGYGEWKTYQEIASSIDAVTVEDFIKNNFILVHVKNVFPAILPAFEEDLGTSGKLEMLQAWLAKNGIEKAEIKDILENLKNRIFEHLKANNIEDRYLVLLENIPL